MRVATLPNGRPQRSFSAKMACANPSPAVEDGLAGVIAGSYATSSRWRRTVNASSTATWTRSALP